MSNFRSKIKKNINNTKLLKFYEFKINKLCDKIICVEAPEKVRIQRIINRDKINEESIKERLNNQTKLKSHIKSVDYYIENVDFDITKKRVISIHNELFN